MEKMTIKEITEIKHEQWIESLKDKKEKLKNNFEEARAYTNVKQDWLKENLINRGYNE